METTKSKIVAGLLGIFFGMLGVHNFYLANTKKALIQCIISVVCSLLFAFCMIFGLLTSDLVIGFVIFLIAFILFVGLVAMTIWGLVEGIMILAGKITKDGKGNAII